MGDALFDLPREDREPVPAKKKWGGRKATNARARCKAMLPWVCRRCGGMIPRDAPDSTWDVGHAEDRAAGGTDTGLEPEHAKCNRSAGGKAGAAIRNYKPAVAAADRERVAQWW